jgi:hypothetical protein
LTVGSRCGRFAGRWELVSRDFFLVLLRPADWQDSVCAERPIREYELLAEIVKSWDHDSNILIIRRTTLWPLLSSHVGSSPSRLFVRFSRLTARSSLQLRPQPQVPRGAFVQLAQRKGKWSKRYLELKNGAVSHAKSEKVSLAYRCFVVFRTTLTRRLSPGQGFDHPLPTVVVRGLLCRSTHRRADQGAKAVRFRTQVATTACSFRERGRLLLLC